MNVVFELCETYLDEFFGGVHAVVGHEAFGVEPALCYLHEELDDAPSVACFFGDYFCESFLWAQVVVVGCHVSVFGP